MSDVIDDATRFRARLLNVRASVESVRDLLREEYDCDCPPEWPRCAVCNARLRLYAIENSIKVELDKVKL